jgi:PEGA domain
LRAFVILSFVLLSACSWFSRRHPAPDPAEIIVTGAPAGSSVFVDGVQTGEITVASNHPQTLTVSAGNHKVEIHLGEAVVYREDTYVGQGEHRAVRVLSGQTR